MITESVVISTPLALRSLHAQISRLLQAADQTESFIDIARTVEHLANKREGLKAVSMDMSYGAGYTCVRAEGTDQFFCIQHRVPRNPWGEPMHIKALEEIVHSS